MTVVVVYGAGGHAKVIADIIENQNEYRLLGFLDDNKEPGTEFYGYKVLGNLNFLNRESGIHGGIVAIGDNWIRKEKVQKIKDNFPWFNFIQAVHPSARIAKGVKIGDGTAIMAGTIINSDAVVGKHCIINTKSSVGHDVLTDDFVTIAPNATISGGVRIGFCSTMSISSTIIQGKKVGDHTVVGAGSTVLDDVPSYVVAYGTPARVIKKRIESDRYLK